MTDTELNNLRKQLYANGYFPVPNLGKACTLKGWNARDFYAREIKRYKGDADAAIDSWSGRFKKYRATGTRVEGGLVVADADVDDESLMSHLVRILREVVPEVELSAPVRFGGGTHKAAWFAQLDGEVFGRIHTRRFIRSLAVYESWVAAVAAWRAAGAVGEAPAEPGYHHVEIFGGAPTKHGNCGRQFGTFGWHTPPDNKQGKPPREYQWADQSLLDVPLAKLPTISKAQAYAITKAFEEAALADGWVPVPQEQEGGDTGGEVFDIDREKTVFDTEHYGQVKYKELESLVHANGDVRLSAGWIDGVVSVSKDRCNAKWSKRFDCVQVQDFGGAMHFPSDIPHGDLKDIADKMEKIKERVQQAPPPPEPEREAEDAAAPPTPPPAAGGVLTHDRVALAFAEAMAEGLRYCHHSGGWYAWDAVYWRRDETLMALHVVRELARQLSKGLTKASALKEARSVGFARSVEKFASSDPRLAVTSAHWDQDPYLMGTPEGTLDLRTGLVRAPDAADGISKLAAMAPARMPTPIWDSFLAQTFKGDEDLIAFNQRWFGYGLTGDTREHALWFGSGSGGNGKGVMLNTIHWLMGDYSRVAPMDMFTAKAHDSHPTELAMLRGARLVTASETEEGRAWAESRIKQLTGGDPISARFMRENHFTYQPQFKLSLIGNHNPRLKNIDDAMRRRFNLVPFRNVVAKADQDQHLQEKLKAEGAGIMQWLVDGCLAWQRGGLQPAAAVRAATDKYFSEQDLVGQWLAEFWEDSAGAMAGSADLFRSWAMYAQGAGAEPGLQRQLTEELDRRGYEQGRNNTLGRYLKGLRPRISKAETAKPGMKSV